MRATGEIHRREGVDRYPKREVSEMRKVTLKRRAVALLTVMLMLCQMLPSMIVLAEEDVWSSAESDQIQMPEYYAVRFIANEEEVVVLNVQAGATVEQLPEAPTLEGCTFLGWVDEDGNPFTASTVVNGAQTVSANYTEIMFSYEDAGEYASVAIEGS